MSAEMAAEQLLAEEAADQARAEAKKAKKQRQKTKKQQALTVLHAQQSRQTEPSCYHGRQESQPAQQKEPQAQHAQPEESQAQHAQREHPQAQHAQQEEQQAQHAQQEEQQAQGTQQEKLHAQHDNLQAQHAQQQAQHAQQEMQQAQHARKEEQQAQHAQQCAQQSEHEQDLLAEQDAGRPLVKTLTSQHAQQALHSQQAAQSEQPFSKQHTQQQQLSQGCQRSLTSSQEQLSAGNESRPQCLKHNSHHQHKQLANEGLPMMPKGEVVLQTFESVDAAAQPSLDQNSQLASTGRHTAAQSMDDMALFNLFCCPLTKVPALCASIHTPEILQRDLASELLATCRAVTLAMPALSHMHALSFGTLAVFAKTITATDA